MPSTRTPGGGVPAATARPPLRLPFVGRQQELALLTHWLSKVAEGQGGTQLVAGVGGIGKTRLVGTVNEVAERQGWTVIIGRAYPVETGVPYALFADAVAPMVRAMTPAALAVHTRGDGAMLAHISPAFAPGAAPMRDQGGDAKARLLWSFAQFVAQLAAHKPLLIALENLQWADTSSLELLHFIARHIGGQRIALLCTYNESELDQNPTLRSTEQSLVSLDVARLMRLEPLSQADLHTLLRTVFRPDAASASTLAARLYSWTRGNPFFTEEILKALVESGALHERDGSWFGWEAELPGLPRSIRDAILTRVDRLSAPARTVANLAAVIGTRVSHDALVVVSGRSEAEVLSALDELRDRGVIAESVDEGVIRYEFTHPLVRDVLYAALGIARAYLLHAAVAESLEALHGDHADEHADELAYHFARAEARGPARKAVRYLAAAGRLALDRHANREAADYLAAALNQYDGAAAASTDAPLVNEQALVELLAQARQRLGEYGASTTLWLRALGTAEIAGDVARVATIRRRIGLASYWSGRYDDALRHFDVGYDAATRAGDDSLQARILMARAMTMHALGQSDAAREDVEHALRIAGHVGDTALLARAHRTSLLLHAFIGPAERAQADGMRALEFAEAAGERGVAWSAHWAMAMVGGLTGNSAAVVAHLAESERLAEALGSPVLRCWTAELAIEYASGSGDWDAGLALAERTIALARALEQRMLLPRLLVWAAMIHLHRNARDRAKQYLDEAHALVGGEGVHNPTDVNAAAPVHAGLVAYHVAVGDHQRALEIGEAGLALVDRTGYVLWGIHRLLPMMTEAALWLEDLDTARRYGDRLRRDSVRAGHRLGMAWAVTCDAVIAMLEKDLARAAPLLRSGADALDSVPWVFDGARVRTKLAWVLAKMGDREGASKELRRAHDLFVRLGAEAELTRTRDLIRELGLRPPARVSTPGIAGLTGREVDVARLVALHKSNKEIAAALHISPRTVSTHLANIFLKLDVGSRGELAEVARRQGMLG